MKIAIIGDISRPINADSSAGTESWTYEYAESLAKRGHEVTLFACKGSQISGKVIDICEPKDLFSKSLNDFSKRKISLFTIEELSQVLLKKDDFDIFHVSLFSFYYFLPIVKFLDKPVVVTVHGYSDFDPNDLRMIFDKYSSPHFVFPSHAFLHNWPEPKNSKVIYHGINIESFSYSDSPEDYFLWIGGICDKKGTGDALKFAQKSGQKLLIAGTKSDPKFFEQIIEPNLTKNIQYVGQLGLKEKNKFFGGAKAVLFTSKIDEAFGLVMTESLACGTPVIAYNVDPVKEIIKDSKNGFVVKTGDVGALVKSSEKIKEIDREYCRKSAEEQFDIEKMTDQYENLYKQIKG